MKNFTNLSFTNEQTIIIVWLSCKKSNGNLFQLMKIGHFSLIAITCKAKIGVSHTLSIVLK